MQAPPPLELHLLGNIELRGGDVASAERLLAQPKIVALLAYLVVPSPGRFIRRDTIVGLLWPELDQVHARGALRKAVHTVRTALGDDLIASRGDEDIAVSAERLVCDVATFNTRSEAAKLSEALEFFRGDLMPGFHLPECGEFDRWLEEERAAVHERAAAAAWALAQRFEQQHQLSDAATWARRAIRFSWSDERAMRRALIMLERLGDRAGAIRLYEEFARRLDADLDIDPSAETLALVARIRDAPARPPT